MQSNCLKLSTILLILKFSIGCDVSFEQLKTCNVMEVGKENFQNSKNIKLNSLINEKKSDNELYNLRFYVQSGSYITIIMNQLDDMDKRTCNFLLIYVSKNSTKTTRKEGVYIESPFPDSCHKRIVRNVSYRPIDLNEYIPLPVRIIITKDDKYTVYISNEESVSYVFPKLPTPTTLNFRQYHDPKGRAKLFYNCTFKDDSEDRI